MRVLEHVLEAKAWARIGSQVDQAERTTSSPGSRVVNIHVAAEVFDIEDLDRIGPSASFGAVPGAFRGAHGRVQLAMAFVFAAIPAKALLSVFHPLRGNRMGEKSLLLLVITHG